MNLCNGYGRDTHDEVCYEANNCPVCNLQDDCNKYEKDLSDLCAKLADAEAERDEAQATLHAYETDIRAAVRLVREPPLP